MKVCSKCREFRDDSCFVKDSSKKDGLYPSCKECYKSAYQENRQSHIVRSKNWRANNREKFLRKKRDYYGKNRDRLRLEMAQYHERNKEKEKQYRKNNSNRLNQKSSEWAANNPIKRRETLRAWRRANPDKVYIQKANRRALEKGATGSISDSEWEALLVKYKRTCLGCMRSEPEIKITMDHVFPLVLGGSNTIENAQPLCRSCNSRKGKKHVDYRADWNLTEALLA